MKFKLLINTEIAKINGNFRFKSQNQLFILLINVKMLTVAGILTFMSSINYWPWLWFIYTENSIESGYFDIYEDFKFHVQRS